MRPSITLIAALLLTNEFAHAEQEFSGIRSQRNHNCSEAERIVISGVGQNITLRGACGAIEVSGTSNTVSVEQVESIAVEGTSNRLSFGSNAQGNKPRVANSGMANSILQDAGLRKPGLPVEAAPAKATAAAPAALVRDPEQCNPTQSVQGVANGQTLQCETGERLFIEGYTINARVTGDCAAVCVSGTNNVITVDGDALAVAISGTSNQVRAKRVDAVSVDGISNTVRYQSSLGGAGPKKDQPKVASEGVSNSVSRQ